MKKMSTEKNVNNFYRKINEFILKLQMSSGNFKIFSEKRSKLELCKINERTNVKIQFV